MPETDGGPHVQPALEAIDERHRRAVGEVELAGATQSVADEVFVGLLIRRIRAPTVRLLAVPARQRLVLGVASLTRQLDDIWRREDRPWHGKPWLRREALAAEAEARLHDPRALLASIDLEGQ